MIEAKSDASPVTEADRAAEAAMRALIQESFPDHGIFGEEEGMHAGSAAGQQGGPSYLWVLDPIDGTKSFITGVLLRKPGLRNGMPLEPASLSRSPSNDETFDI